MTRTVNIGANGEIELSNIAGDIVVTRGSGTAATIEVVKTARGASADEARAMLALVQVDITERGTRAEARTRYPSERRAAAQQPPQHQRLGRLQRRRAGGHADHRQVDLWRHQRARHHAAALTLETVSGNVRIANAGRMASGRSISGDIELVDTKVDGALEAGTISGTVRLRRVTAREPGASTR